MKRGGFLPRLFFSLVLLAIILHTAAHFVVYEAGIFGITDEGISGLSVGNLPVGERLQEGYPIRAPISRIIVIAEWVFVIAITLWVYVRDKFQFDEEYKELKVLKEKKSGSKTDLDLLCEMLKEKKRIRFKIISKLFNVNDDLIREWGNVLSGGNFARVEYSHVGDAELVLAEKK